MILTISDVIITFGEVIITFGEVIITFGEVIITIWAVIITIWASLSPFGRHYHRFDLSLTEGVAEVRTTTEGWQNLSPLVIGRGS